MKRAVLREPKWRYPVGEGANLVRAGRSGRSLRACLSARRIGVVEMCREVSGHHEFEDLGGFAALVARLEKLVDGDGTTVVNRLCALATAD